VNKTQLVDALSARYEGNRRQAQHALESVLDVITREVARGEKVAITGFGSFEKRVREARWVRNPRTGDRIKAKKTAIPKFTAGADLKAVVSGAKKLPKVSDVAKVATAPARQAASVAASTGAAKRAAAVARKATGTTSKSTTSKSSASKSTASKSSTAKKSSAKKSPAKKSSSTSKSTSKRTAAKKS
jgi:DNA-binding protein HU-beta